LSRSGCIPRPSSSCSASHGKKSSPPRSLAPKQQGPPTLRMPRVCRSFAQPHKFNGRQYTMGNETANQTRTGAD